MGDSGAAAVRADQENGHRRGAEHEGRHGGAARSPERSEPQRSRSEPSSTISGSSSTPNASRTVARASTISASTSSARAPPRLTMTLACFGLICAAPERRPLRPAASISRPAWSPAGLRKIDPALGRPEGRLAQRLRLSSSMRASAVAASPRRSWKVARRHHHAGALERRPAIRRLELADAVALPAAVAMERGGRDQHVLDLDAVAARVHHHRAADARRESRRTPRGRAGRATPSSARAAAAAPRRPARSRSPQEADAREDAAEARHHAAESLVGIEDVRAETEQVEGNAFAELVSRSSATSARWVWAVASTSAGPPMRSVVSGASGAPYSTSRPGIDSSAGAARASDGAVGGCARVGADASARPDALTPRGPLVSIGRVLPAVRAASLSSTGCRFRSIADDPGDDALASPAHRAKAV